MFVMHEQNERAWKLNGDRDMILKKRLLFGGFVTKEIFPVLS